MAMTADHIKLLIEQGLPGAQIEIKDLAGDGDHYAASIIWDGFRELPRVRQHQLVYDALDGRMGRELHALALTTTTPES